MEDTKPHEISNGEVLYTADAEDQGQALDECVAWALPKYVLNTIIWKEMEDGKHVFTVNYIAKIDDSTQSSNPDLSACD